MCTDRYELSANVVRASTVSRTKRTSPTEEVSRSFPACPPAPATARQWRVAGPTLVGWLAAGSMTRERSRRGSALASGLAVIPGYGYRGPSGSC